MVVIDNMRLATTFITVINKKSVANKEHFDRVVNECKFAEAMGKPMYALVEKGINLGVLAGMPWKKMVRFNKTSEVPDILNFIDGDIRAGGFYT